MKLALAAFSVLLFAADIAAAKDFPVQARLFAGSTSADPKDVNTEFEAQGLKKVKSLTQFGVEMTYPVAKLLDVGLRYTRRQVVRDELTSTPLTDYQGQIDQDSAMFVARIPFLKTNIVRLDAFAGVGGSNTTLKIKTATQDGQAGHKDPGEFFATPCASYGGSMAIGYKQFYLVIEGGVESNKVTGLKRSGTINDNIKAIDLSGSYVTVGLLFSGISASSK